MMLDATLLALAATLAVVTGGPGPAAAQQPRGVSAPRAANLQVTADLRARIGLIERRIAEGRRDGAITRARAATLDRQVAQTRASMTRLSRRQGFVSAAELASYNRTLDAIGVELDRRGVAPDGDAAGFRYDCQNDPIAISIPGGGLDGALDRFSRVTRCPVSGTDLARGRQSRPVAGTMTPTAALQAVLAGTGLQMQAIKGGFQIVRLPRR